jgi:uncharacterized protein YhfF|nr:ASCH domain-containing protein [Anaerosolibacter sp.]
MMSQSDSVETMWEGYLNSLNEGPCSTEKTYKSWHFCDNEEDANELAELVLKGIKRATASLYLGYEYENEKVPEAGDHSIITDWNGMAQCIIRTKEVTIMPYKEVSEEFAATEGEGDGSLEYWRNAHWSYFSREMEAIGKDPTEDMLVVCEEFEVVYK